MNITLAQALRVSSSACIAFIGAGGKTTALFQLARQLTPPVIVTTTTHLGAWQVGQADQHLIGASAEPLEELEPGLQGITLVTGARQGDRFTPINDHLMEWLKQFCSYHAIPLLIEADGSRQKPLKAWADHEPAIPSEVDIVVQVAGLTGLNAPLNLENVHRPGIFAGWSALKPGDAIVPEAVVRVLAHPLGGLKNIPPGARRVVLLNQADTPALQAAAQGLAQALMPPYHSVIIASLQQEKICAVHEPVAGILLAAGGSTRYGKPKQLLDWKGQPFVRVIARTALDAGLSPVVVVTGANAGQIEAALKDLNVVRVPNPDWQSGQASSIRAGLQHLTPNLSPLPKVNNVGAAIFLLADQPQLTASVLRALAEKHAEGLYPIVAPMVQDQRANPVLFDRITFPDLLQLEGDVGGRAVFHKHRVEYLPWHDDRLLLDVDTPEMYQRLISDETL